MNDKDRLTL